MCAISENKNIPKVQVLNVKNALLNDEKVTSTDATTR